VKVNAMSLILKLDGDPAWLPPKTPSYYWAVILLKGSDDDVLRQPVDVPADLLLAVSPLLRSILSAGHLPPAYYQPAISLPSVSVQVLQTARELFVSGMVRVDTRAKVTDIQAVFKMLGIVVELTCDQPQGVKLDNDHRRHLKKDNGVIFNHHQIIPEKIEEFIEHFKTEDEYSKGKILHRVKSRHIVKVEPDPILQLNDSPIRPSTGSSPLYSRSTPVHASKVPPDPKHLAEFCCDICKRKFRTENELTKHASEDHNDELFRCLYCQFSAESKRDLYEHRRLAHIDQIKCDICGISTFDSYVKFKRHKRSQTHVNNCKRKFGVTWSCGKCRERFSSVEGLAAHKNERKHHDNDPKGS